MDDGVKSTSATFVVVLPLTVPIVIDSVLAETYCAFTDDVAALAGILIVIEACAVFAVGVGFEGLLVVGSADVLPPPPPQAVRLRAIAAAAAAFRDLRNKILSSALKLWCEGD